MTTVPSLAAPRPRRRHGYTVVEVMMALAVLSIGATGVVAMQRATLLGNVNARNLATATAIATAWLERLDVDALRWRINPTGLNTIAQTSIINLVGDDFPNISGQEGQWVRAPALPALGYSPMADVRGYDTSVDSNTAYCTHIRLTQLMPNMIRAEVRVFWLKNKPNQSTLNAGTINGKPLCVNDAGIIGAVGTAQNRYHFVYLMGALLRNDSGG
jgi:type IV pilus assembly protein PilV